MTRKKKRRNSIVEIGSGSSRVKIYTINRKNGYREFTLYWREGGRLRRRSISCIDEARMVAQQISVKIANGWQIGGEATKRDLELLWYCERQAESFGVTLAAAMDEWVSARSIVKGMALSDAVRFYQANRVDLFAVKDVSQVADEFIESLVHKGVSDIYVRNAKDHLKRFATFASGKINDVTVAEINRFLYGLTKLGPVSKNHIRRNLVTMFGFAKRQGYLHPDRKTAAELSEKFKAPETEIEIFTPEEMNKILMASHARLLPVLAIGGFAGVRSAEIQRLHWEDIKWDRGYIEISGRKAKTASRRLATLSENLKAWLAPWRDSTGPVVCANDVSGALGDVAIKAGIPGGWRQNALRHSFISYRVAETGDVPRTALEAGNSPKMIFRHYREVVDEESAKAWFSIMPPEGWVPQGFICPNKHRRRIVIRRKIVPPAGQTVR